MARLKARPDKIVRYAKYARERFGLVDGDCNPDWTHYRIATELWLDYRIETAFKEVMAVAKTKEEVCKSMEQFMKVVQFEVRAMIRGEDQWWGMSGNPLRQPKDKEK